MGEPPYALLSGRKQNVMKRFQTVLSNFNLRRYTMDEIRRQMGVRYDADNDETLNPGTLNRRQMGVRYDADDDNDDADADDDDMS
jgi:hypothetical protein